MATTYQQNMFDGASEGYVKYSITPELGAALAPGDTVKITGTAYYRDYASKSVRIDLYEENDINIDEFGVTSIFSAYVNKSISKGKATNFTLSFKMPDASKTFTGANGRTKKVLIGFSLYTDSEAAGSGSLTRLNTAQKLLLLKYRLAPKIIDMDFERCTSAGAWADDGQYLRCRTLKISKSSQAVVGDITKKSLVLKDQDGTVKKTVDLTTAQLNTMLTSAGYTETKPTLFSGVTTNLGLNYTVTLTLGDAYDQQIATDKVARSFARLHLSGRENGGVAVGMFSSATDKAPKFEVADNHKSYFYGGIESIGTTAVQCTASQQAMGIQYGTIAISAKENDEGIQAITFAVPFTSIPSVFINCATYSGIAYAKNEFFRVSGITETGATLRFYNTYTGGGTRSRTFNWLAIGPMGEAPAADPSLPEGPEIFDDDDNFPYADAGIARTDYIAMMAGIEIPADAGEAQADPGAIDGPGLDEPAHSAKFELVKLYYNAKVWNEQMVRAAVGRWITADEAEEIIGNTDERESERHDGE